MKRILLLISLFTVMSFSCDTYCKEKLERIANSLERIANLMQKEYNMELEHKNTVRESYSAPVKNYDVQINGRSLKAVPTSSIFTEDEFLTCKSECKERFKLYTEIEDCIKRYCGEE